MKGVTFLSNVGYEGVSGWTSGGASPYKTLLHGLHLFSGLFLTERVVLLKIRVNDDKITINMAQIQRKSLLVREIFREISHILLRGQSDSLVIGRR